MSSPEDSAHAPASRRALQLGTAALLFAIVTRAVIHFTDEGEASEPAPASATPAADTPAADAPDTAATKAAEPKREPPAPEPEHKHEGDFPLTERSMLALTWQPAFCETHRKKPECRNEGPDDVQARQFSLHGLWPDGCAYREVPEDLKEHDMRGRWRELPAVKLEASTRTQLERDMPGTRSLLERHEWIKHGSCDGRSAEGYYRTSLALLAQVNDSALRELFVSRIGKTLTLDEARAAFERDFGPRAGEALVMKCEGPLIEEIRLRLGRPLNPSTPLADALQRNTARSCSSGRVDAGG